MMTDKIDWRIATCAIIALAAIEITALLNGIDGTLMVLIVAAIAGVAGYKLKK